MTCGKKPLQHHNAAGAQQARDGIKSGEQGELGIGGKKNGCGYLCSLPSRFSTARLMVRTPVFIVGSGIG